MDNEGVRSKLLLPPGRLLRLGASQMLANSYASVISRRLGFANEASLPAGAGSTFSACKSNHAGTSAGVVEYHRAPEHVSHVADLQGPQPPFFFSSILHASLLACQNRGKALQTGVRDALCWPVLDVKAAPGAWPTLLALRPSPPPATCCDAEGYSHCPEWIRRM